eukprot:COSAG06_NODE_285_length_18323_cov_93.673672_7_plen_80_part_00
MACKRSLRKRNEGKGRECRVEQTRERELAYLLHEGVLGRDSVFACVGGVDESNRVIACRNAVFVSTFLMFVPSLSWQIF